MKKSTKIKELNEILEEYKDSYEVFENLEIIEELKNRLIVIPDKRHPSYIRHNLIDIVLIAFFAVLADANEWSHMEIFAKKQEKWLMKFLELPNGIPTDDTIRIVISSKDSRYFYSILIQFLTEKIDQIIKVHQISQNIEKIEERDIISCDGKESRGSKREETNKEAVKSLNTLSAYSNNYEMSIGQVYIKEKSNEISGMLDLLDIIHVEGAILTWDALNTQKKTVEKVIKKGADYVGALKGNQHNFYKDVVEYFDEEVCKEIEGKSYEKTVEKAEKGIVTRGYYMTEEIEWLNNKEKWSGLKSIGMVRKTVEKSNGEVIKEERYYISSLRNISEFSKAIRNHWGVENGLHWHLDYTFRDDQNTSMEKNGAKNLQVLKKVAMRLLKMVKGLYKLSLNKIRYTLSLDFENEIKKVLSVLDVKNIQVL